MSRDPWNEGGGVNLYQFVLNSSIGMIDALGLSASDSPASYVPNVPQIRRGMEGLPPPGKGPDYPNTHFLDTVVSRLLNSTGAFYSWVSSNVFAGFQQFSWVQNITQSCINDGIDNSRSWSRTIDVDIAYASPSLAQDFLAGLGIPFISPNMVRLDVQGVGELHFTVWCECKKQISYQVVPRVDATAANEDDSASGDKYFYGNAIGVFTTENQNALSMCCQ